MDEHQRRSVNGGVFRGETSPVGDLEDASGVSRVNVEALPVALTTLKYAFGP